MKQIIFICLFLIGCGREVKFDDNEIIDVQLKRNIHEYHLLTLDKRNEYILMLQKKQKGDTSEYILYADNSIGIFKERNVNFFSKYNNIYVFTNYKNRYFKDSIGFEKALKYLDKEEYNYFIKEKQIPPPLTLRNIMQLKLIFVRGQLVKKEYFY